MDHSNSTTLTPDRERGQHLRYEDRISIKIYRRLGYSLRGIAAMLDCSPSTVMNEIRRGTGVRKGDRGRHPEYSPKRGQAHYEVNRSRCHKDHILNDYNPFVQWMTDKVRNRRWSLDACVGYARRHKLFPEDQIPCTKTLYNELWAGNLPITLFDVPEALSRSKRRSIHERTSASSAGVSTNALRSHLLRRNAVIGRSIPWLAIKQAESL